MTRSLRHLIADHATLLVVDCASATTFVGILRDDGASLWESLEAPAGEALFSAVDRLQAAGFPLSQVGAFAFNAGPGSILGIRTAAVAIRTWRSLRSRPVFQYQGLVALAEAERLKGRPLPFHAIADARRDTWHCVKVETGTPLSLRRVPHTELPTPAIAPTGFRTWAALPTATETVAYKPAEFLTVTRDCPLFEETAEPDAFLHEEPSYKTWTPEIHRAPSP
ncbi:peptidase M22 [Nibricoccus sp. IMCC34717]|uniref:peptidase M22 n=1 Tax=Nibricoccus sp. IMCC34717 TaxID=3034021 RepID=UPI00384DAEF1